MARRKKGYHKLTGTSNLKYDRRHKALKPGKRVSKSGKVYYEYRKNRADVRGRTPKKSRTTRRKTRKRR
jgi:hypothetical protein